VLLVGLALAVSVVAAGCGQSKAHKASAAQRDRTMAQLDRIVRSRVDSRRLPGIVAGMVFPDGSTRVVAYGDAGRGKRLDADSVFEIGSITKVFTASVLSDMVQRGQVKLADRVARLLPSGVSVPSRDGREITLLDLATHSSGLPREATNLPSKDPDRPYAGYTAARLYAFLKDYQLTRVPGSRVEYSNVGEGLLGQALALRAGVSYEQLVRARILDPLHMTSSDISLRADQARHVPVGHDAEGTVVPPFEMGALAGAGSLRSTIGDMLRFATANLDQGGGRLQQAMAITHTPRKRFGTEQIGLNWIITHGILWHNGGTSGFSSFIGLDPARHTAIVVLSNSRAEMVDDIGFHMLDKRMPLAPVPITINLPRHALARYVGLYTAAGTTARITHSVRGLSLQLGTTTARLYAQTNTTFLVKRLMAAIEFRLNASGKVTGLVFHDSNGKTYVATKIR
jgi:CubicO group peptidase (beta-lactamase class C family)